MGLHGGTFSHAHSSTLDKYPKYVRWSNNAVLDTNCFTDESIIHGMEVKCKHKIAWLLELPDILAAIQGVDVIDYVKKNHEEISKEYDFVFTWRKDLVGLHDNFVFMPGFGYWVKTPGLHPKSKLVSMVSSGKGLTEGHKYRLSWVEKLKGKVDLYGREFNFIDTKDEGVNDYMFSVAMENASVASWWTEKLLDCFVAGTVPIYWGDPEISDYFNPDGMIFLDDSFDIGQLNTDEYIKRKEAIRENFHIAMQYDVIEDVMYDKYLYNFV
tara:strand:- start:396 stop:1202 length:807 start_codon:yes stop_codon:yes gene_type:complete